MSKTTVSAAESIIVNLGINLARFRNMPDHGTAEEARFTVRSLVKETLALQRQDHGLPIVHSIQEAALMVWSSGLHLAATPEGDLLASQESFSKGWQGVLAATLLTPAWRLNKFPSLETIPDWLWGHYARWILHSPTGAVERGASDAFARPVIQFLKQVAQWSDRNLGSAAIRAACAEVVRFDPTLPLLQSNQSLKDAFQAIAKIQARLSGGEAIEPYYPIPREEPRAKIKIGFVFAWLANIPPSLAARSLFDHLDREEFEVVLFTRGVGDANFEAECRQSVAEIITLEPTAKAAVETLRKADLDVVAFTSEWGLRTKEWIDLARNRVAPVQVILPDWSATSGVPVIDLRFLGRDQNEPSSERVAVLASTNANIFPPTPQELDAESRELLRTSLALPATGPILAASTDVIHFSPDTLHAWGEILHRVPEAHLVWSMPTHVDRSTAKFFASLVCIAKNLKPSRIVLQYDDRRSALALAHLYLDPIGFSSTEGFSSALAYGLPAVSLHGTTLRGTRVSALLKTCQLEDGVVRNVDEYIERAISLLTQSALRERVAVQARDALANFPVLTDALAESDAFAAVIRHAVQLSQQESSSVFSSQKPPLRAAEPQGSAEELLKKALSALEAGELAEAGGMTTAVLGHLPSSSIARHLQGRVLSAQGRFDRAIAYLTAALQGHEDSADLWWEIAVALRQLGANAQAIPALEGCLRVDPNRIEAWEMLNALAREAGHDDLTEKTQSVLQALRPATVAG